MTVSKNDVTGDSIRTKDVSEKYRDNYDNIFRKTVVESILDKQNGETNENQTIPDGSSNLLVFIK